MYRSIRALLQFFEVVLGPRRFEVRPVLLRPSQHAAEWLKELLVEAGMQHEFVPFNGGHTIGEEALEKLGAFLTKQLQP